MTGLVIEGEDLRVDAHLVDARRMMLKPGFYVRHRGDCLSVADPIYPERVQAALVLGAEHRRNLIAVGEDGLPHVIETITTAIEFGELGAWHADVILLPHGRRHDAVSIKLPLAK